MEVITLLHLLLPFVGLTSLLNLSLPLLRWLYAAFLRPAKNLRQVYGPWAVVTGATDGIGRAIAVELASRGLNLVLVGRSSGKLKKTSEGISTKCRETQIRTVVWDLAEGAGGGTERLRAAIADVEVGLLVNCAGATYPAALYFHEVEERVWRDVVGVNVEGTSLVTRVVLPEMVRRRRGAVVNVGSASSVAVPSFPLYAVYAATKAYVNKLSRSLNVAYKSMGIDIQCQIPFYVATKMVSMEEQPSSTFIPTPEDYAKAAVRCIGYEPLVSPYWSHSIQWLLASCLPDFLLDTWRLRVGISKRIKSTK